MTSFRRRSATSLCALVFCMPATALALDSTRSLDVVAPSCAPPLDLQRFLEASRVELRDAGVDQVEMVARTGASPNVTLGPSCDPAAFTMRLRLGPDDVVPNAERTLDLLNVVDAQRPRTAAIALAELLRAARDDPSAEGRLLGSTSLPESGPPTRPDPSTSAMADTPPSPDVRLSAGAMARVWLASSLAHFGPRIDGRLRLAGPVDVAFGVAALVSSSDDPLGASSSSSFLARAGLSLTHRAPPFLIDLGPALELGGFFVGAQGARADVVAQDASSFVAAAIVGSGVELAPVDALRIRLDLELGAAMVGLETFADRRQAPSYFGAEVSASLSVGLAL